VSSPNHDVTVRASLPAEVGKLGELMSAIAETGALVGGVEIVESTGASVTRDIALRVRDEAHAETVSQAMAGVEGVDVEGIADRAIVRHVAGKIGMRNRAALVNNDDLAMAYTPGVARVCMAINADPEAAWDYTIKGNSVMLVSDGSAVLGEGDLGPLASLPALEARALFLRELAGVDGFPLPVDERFVDRIAEAVRLAASPFAGVHLSDIAAPRTFDLERELSTRLDIPVLADERAEAAALLAGLWSGLGLVGGELERSTVVVAGAGASGLVVAQLLVTAGAGAVIVCDEAGAINSGRSDLDPGILERAQKTNTAQRSGGLRNLLAGAQALVVAGADLSIKPADVGAMAPDPVVLTLPAAASALPTDAAALAGVVSTGRPDGPNYLSGALAFTGLWRAALDARVSAITDEMLLAAARAIRATAEADGITADRIVPTLLAPNLVANVAVATHAAARESGVAGASTA
jgi:malate dehydrogenase (oxaloacetate-decarboxylating)